jgi:carbamoyl-phosphate synthase large subunit
MTISQSKVARFIIYLHARNTARFEPSIDYIVTKIPRFAFEVHTPGHHSAGRCSGFRQKAAIKPPFSLRRSAETSLRMKSIGEAMAIGRIFKESLQKCLRSPGAHLSKV